jgi:predicted MFS family arabinose efflux permease
MAFANVIRAVAASTLCLLVLTHSGSIALLYAVAFVLGSAETLYDSAARALLPQVVGVNRLDAANSVLTVEETLGQTFLGAPLGSALFTLAALSPFLVNATGFVLAVALILTLRGDFRTDRSDRSSLGSEMRDGIRWLHGHELLRPLTVISAATAFLETIGSGVLVLYVLDVLGLPAGGYGLILLAGGGGAVIGGLATPPLARRAGRPAMLTLGAVVAAVTTGLMATTRNGVLAAVYFAISGAGVMVWNVLTMSLRQALIPAHLFGRVQGAYRTLVFGSIALGSLVGGALASAIGLRGVFAVAGAGMLLCAWPLARVTHRHRMLLADEPARDHVALS